MDFISVLNVKEGEGAGQVTVATRKHNVHRSWGQQPEEACLRGLHSICFIRDSVCNLCWGGDGQSHRATHCFIVYNEEQCFRMFVSFVPIF